MIWTGIRPADVSAAPPLIGQGREHDEVVKRDGRWRCQPRVITSDGGLPPMFEKTCQHRACRGARRGRSGRRAP